MRASDRFSLIRKGMLTAEDFCPVTLTFPDFDPVPASTRSAAATAAMRNGGLTDSLPAIFYVRKEIMPAGLLDALIAAEATSVVFDADGLSYRLNAFDNEASEPQVRLTCDLASK